PSADGCRQIFVDARGAATPDPWSLLGLSPQAQIDEDTVRAAWVRQLEAHPPEQDPEGARLLREARDRLLSVDHLYERKFGLLTLPEVEPLDLPAPRQTDEDASRLPARARILGQLVVYAIVEHWISASEATLD